MSDYQQLNRHPVHTRKLRKGDDAMMHQRTNRLRLLIGSQKPSIFHLTKINRPSLLFESILPNH
jgi:hypothetical protein